MKSHLLFITLIFLGYEATFAQRLPNKSRLSLEGAAFVSSTGKTTFWQRANQFGIVPRESQFVSLRAGLWKEYDSTDNKKYGWGYGLNSVVNLGKANQLLLPEAYVKTHYGAFEVYAGRRREIIGLIDTSLTMGSIIWSGNALPMPKIQLSIPNYTSIIGKGLISIKGGYAHGWFGTQTHTKGYYLHQKWLYGKIGRESWKVNFFGGFNHQAQWGGYSEI